MTGLAVTPASFVQDFPEFANTGQYPTSVVAYYLALANLLLNQNRWGAPATTVTNPPTTLIDMAAELFVAHNLVLEYAAQRAAASGGLPGVNVGAVASKGVGPISISYDNGATAIEGAGLWNATTYGKRFWMLSEMAGAGPMQLTGGCGFAGPFNGATAWMGPPVWPGYFWNT